MVDKVLQWCDYKSVVADVILLNSAIDAYINCGSITKAQDLFHIITADHVEDYANHRNQKVIRELHLDFMINSKIAANVRTYNTLLKSYRNMENEEGLQQCMDIMERMQERHIQPDTITINTLIDVCVTANRLAYAEEVTLHYDAMMLHHAMLCYDASPCYAML